LTAQGSGDTLQKEMNTILFTDKLNKEKDTLTLEESLNEVWSRFERTGSIGAFLAYRQTLQAEDSLIDPLQD
jgi:hypothetical protein